MFGKLCKYEWKYMMRFFLPMWGVVLVLSVVNRFTMPMMISPNSEGREIAGGLLFMALVLVMCAVCVVATVIIIQRFYNGLLKDEGYLMFTLPVKSGALINAKGLMSVVLLFITGIVCLLVILIVATGGATWQDFTEFMSELFRLIRASALEWTMVILWGIVMTLVCTAESLYQIYMAMALGHLAKKHRVGWSVVAYLVISMVKSAVFNVLAFNSRMWDGLWEFVYNATRGMSGMQQVVATELGVSALYALLTLLYFFITRHILEKRLNLE